MRGTTKRSLSFTDLTQDHDVVDPVRNDDDEEVVVDPVRKEEDDSKENAEGKRFPVGFVSGYVLGEVHPGEDVVLVREPNNSDDSNAVRVDNLTGEKVGNIQRDLAAALAPILDQNIAKLDATISSRGDGRKIPICIVDNPAFNNDNDECRLVAILQEHGLALRTTKDVPEEHQQPTIQTARVSARKPQNQQLNKVFDEQSNERFANLPEMPALPWQQDTDLLSHQEMGIRWMVHRETASDVSVPFTSQLNQPTLRGGILAGRNLVAGICHKPMVHSNSAVSCVDDMGLGKTIQAIGLILANRPKEDVKPKAATVAATLSLKKSWLQRPTKTFIKSVGIKQLRQASHALGITPTNMTKPKLVNALHAKLWDGTLTPEQFHDAIKAPTYTIDEVTTDNPWAGCTLIVCPVSVISNWVQQIEQHVVPGTLRVATYYGTSRRRYVVRYEMSNWSRCRFRAIFPACQCE